jgi:hypothetical protein
MKSGASILMAGAVLAFAAAAGNAATDSMASHAGKQAPRHGIGPYAYLGNTAPAR